MTSEHFKIEPDDKVEFTAADDYGPITATGTVRKVYKTSLLVEWQGKTYRTYQYELLSKAG